MKCSDCAFWKTDRCKTNPEGTDYNCAEDFLCFVHDPDARARRETEGVLTDTRPATEDEADIHGQLPKSALRSGGWLAITGMVGALGVWIWMTTSSDLGWDEWMIATIPLAISEILVLAGWLAVLGSRKGRLPTLTRIAVGMMVVISVISVLMALAGIVMSPSQMGFILFSSPWAFLYLPVAPAVFLTFKEKWAWWAATAAFVIGPVFLFFPPFWHFHPYMAIYLIFSAAIPLILVIIDGTKYWEMAEKARNPQPPDEPAGQ